MDVWTILAKYGCSLKDPGDEFFVEGDIACGMKSAVYCTQEDDEEYYHRDYREFPCSAPNCCESFTQLIDFEIHYNSRHKFACSTCSLNLPSSYLLELHVIESHDTFFSLLALRQPSYECWLQTCQSKFMTKQERKNHAVKFHNFPEDFVFQNQEQPTNLRKPKSLIPSPVKRRPKKSSSSSSSSSSAATSPAKRPVSIALIGKYPEEEQQQEKKILQNKNNETPISSKNNNLSSPIRRLSLFTPTNNVVDTITSAPVIGAAHQSPLTAVMNSPRRGPFSLATMGEGRRWGGRKDEDDDLPSRKNSDNVFSNGSGSSGSESNSLNSPSNKIIKPSRIPVRSFSYRNVSFGQNVEKTFENTEKCYQNNYKFWKSPSQSKEEKIEKMDITTLSTMTELKSTLPGID